MKSILMFLLMLIAINASSQDDAQRMIQRVERDGQKPDNSRYYLYEDKMIEFFKANNWQDEVVSIKEIWVEKPDQILLLGTNKNKEFRRSILYSL